MPKNLCLEASIKILSVQAFSFKFALQNLFAIKIKILPQEAKTKMKQKIELEIDFKKFDNFFTKHEKTEFFS